MYKNPRRKSKEGEMCQMGEGDTHEKISSIVADISNDPTSLVACGGGKADTEKKEKKQEEIDWRLN